MGFIDRLKGFAGNEDMDYNEYEGDLFDDTGDVDYDTSYNAPIHDDRSRKTSTGGGISAGSSSLELKVVKPEKYESVTQIADHLLSKRTVVLNLESSNKETARRLIDFLSGVAYSIDGQLKRVANNTFVITPHNVDVTGEQLKSEQPKEENPGDLYSEL